MSTMRKLWGPFIISFVIIGYQEVLSKKRICIIGAGRAGLAAVKKVADQIDKFEPFAFERNSDVGGLWIYRDDPNKDEHDMEAHSGIYKHMRTNLPINIMAYPDYLDFYGKGGSKYVSHEMFLEYMKNYTDYFQLRKYIQFDTFVTKVIPEKGYSDWTTTTWRLEKRNLNTNIVDEITCDAVMVCNGHYSKPYMPEIPGLKETFPGRVLHSRNYRIPEVFVNKTVVVLGAGNSGVDIAIDLANYAKNVYLSHKHKRICDPRELPSNVQLVRSVVSAESNKLTLQDNTTITANTFIFCTGYSYDFPFLDERSGITFDRKEIRPLYARFINIVHPSMAFVGLAPTPDHRELYYLQLRYFLELLKGERKLPIRYKDMLEDAKFPEDFVG